MVKLILGVVFMCAAGAVFFLYTQGAYDSMKGTQAKIAEYNTALDKAAELQKLKQNLLERFNAFDPQALDRLKKLLPDHVDNIALILDLDSIAGRYGLALQNVDVSSSAPQTKSRQVAVGAIGTANQGYDSLTFSFSTQGTYSNFLQFMTALESSLRVVDLSSLAIGRASSVPGTGASKEPLYSYNLTLRTYWLK